MLNLRSAWLWLCMTLALAACSAKSPQLIGAQPKQIGSAGYSSFPTWPIVYNAYMEMEVTDAGATVRAAAQVARDYGGYLADGQVVDEESWGAQKWSWNVVDLVIPAPNFDGAHNALLSLGRLVREDISGEPLGGRPDEAVSAGWSRLTVHFREVPGTWAPVQPGWNPGRTLQKAFAWFARIFTFLADVVIWVVVVGGPFVLMGWGAVALWRRLQKRR